MRNYVKNKTLFRLCSPVFSQPTDSSQGALSPPPELRSRSPPPGNFPDCPRSRAPAGLPSAPAPVSCSARGVLEACWAPFQSSDSRGTGTESRACERQLAVECDLLEGEGGETEPPWWGRTPKSAPAQRGGVRRPGEGSVQPTLLPCVSLPQCGAKRVDSSGRKNAPPTLPSCCTSVPRQSQLLILAFV